MGSKGSCGRRWPRIPFHALMLGWRSSPGSEWPGPLAPACPLAQQPHPCTVWGSAGTSLPIYRAAPTTWPSCGGPRKATEWVLVPLGHSEVEECAPGVLGAFELLPARAGDRRNPRAWRAARVSERTWPARGGRHQPLQKVACTATEGGSAAEKGQRKCGGPQAAPQPAGRGTAARA